MSVPRQLGLVGGVEWQQSPPNQEIVELTSDDAASLMAGDRLERLKSAGAKPLILKGTPRRGGGARLLLMGSPDAVERSRCALRQMLSKEMGLAIALHPDDTRNLRKPTRRLIADVEAESRCRIMVDRRELVDDPVADRKQHLIHLLGDDVAQAKARDLLSPHCQRLQLSGIATKWFQGFSPVHGRCVEVGGEGATMAWRTDNSGKENKGFVIAGNGQCRSYMEGSFFCVGISRVDANLRLRGHTRVGVMCSSLEAPVPETLIMRPRQCWVVGGKRARGVGRCAALPSANFDALEAGDEIGILVTPAGGLAAFCRSGGAFDQWRCLLHWDAGVTNARVCFPVIEFGGGLLEVEVLQHGPPRGFDQPYDVVSETPPIWP